MTAVTDTRSLCDTATYASRCSTDGSCAISNFGGNNHKYESPHLVTVDYYHLQRILRPEAFPAIPAQDARESVDPPTRHHLPDRDLPVLDRARCYLARVPPAVAGAHGDVHTFQVCCRITRGFDLDEEQALAVLRDWNALCQPPWQESELRDKLRHALQYGREPVGGLL